MTDDRYSKRTIAGSDSDAMTAPDGGQRSRRTVLRAIPALTVVGSLAGCSSITGGNGGGGSTTDGGGGSGLTPVEMTSDNWRFPTGDWEFEGDVMRNTTQDTGSSAIAKNVRLQDGTVAAEMNSVDGKKGMQLFWRGDGEFRTNYHRFGPLTLNNNPRLHWDLIENGDFPGHIKIDPMDELPVDVGPDEFHDYRVEFKGSRHRMYVDDTLIYEGEDDRLSGFTHIGFHLGYTCEIRNVRYAEGVPENFGEESTAIGTSGGGEVIDNFEDGDISEYGGQTDSFRTTQSNTYDGSAALEGDGPSDEVAQITSVSGLDRYPHEGDVFAVPFRIAEYNQRNPVGDNRYAVTVGFGKTNDDRIYEITFDTQNQNNSGGELTFDNGVNNVSTGVNVGPQTWYELRVAWGSEDVEVTLREAGESAVGSVRLVSRGDIGNLLSFGVQGLVAQFDSVRTVGTV